MTQANKASSKYSSILPVCRKVSGDLFLTSAITNKGFPGLSVKPYLMRLLFFLILRGNGTRKEPQRYLGDLEGQVVYRQQSRRRGCAEHQESHVGVTRPARVYK